MIRTWPIKLLDYVAQGPGNLAPIPMGFVPGGVWVMGYRGCMGYGMHFPANQLGGLKNLWGIREYGLSGLWVTRESTVYY